MDKSDPLVIYGFYDLLYKEMKRLDILDKPEAIWNCDESGFPSDPSKCKFVGPIGKKSIQVVCGANRENTTVLVVVCAGGRALDPLIMFKGANFQSNSQVLPETYFAVSETG